MLNEVISYWSINIWSCCGNTVVHINPQRKVVKDGGRDLKIKRIAQIIRVGSFPEIPVICENGEKGARKVRILLSCACEKGEKKEKKKSVSVIIPVMSCR